MWLRFNFEAVYSAFLIIIKLNKSNVQKQVTSKLWHNIILEYISWDLLLEKYL